jgi:hypothetical protein
LIGRDSCARTTVALSPSVDTLPDRGDMKCASKPSPKPLASVLAHSGAGRWPAAGEV